MKFEYDFDFGDLVQDKHTGFVGKVTGVASYIEDTTYYRVEKIITTNDSDPAYSWIESDRLIVAR